MDPDENWFPSLAFPLPLQPSFYPATYQGRISRASAVLCLPAPCCLQTTVSPQSWPVGAGGVGSAPTSPSCAVCHPALCSHLTELH